MVLRLAAVAFLSAASADAAAAAELTVFTSGGFDAAYRTLVRGFERASGDHVKAVAGPSMGATPQAIPNRLQRGEGADVVIVARGALDELVSKGFVAQGSEVDLARSRIAVAVKAGAPMPDISSPQAFKATLLAAKSVAYSDSASGVYLSTELFRRLGVTDQMAPKARMVPATPVGQIVADGGAELGMQQLSELKPIPGIQVVGLIPESLQKVTVFSAGVVSKSKHPDEARALISYLASKQSGDVIRDSGMAPVASDSSRP
jgi:molybdate transport system substrate-binding protein